MRCRLLLLRVAVAVELPVAPDGTHYPTFPFGFPIGNPRLVTRRC